MSSRKRSVVWRYFTQMEIGKAECGVCGFACSYHNGSTSNLRKHLKIKHPSVFISENGFQIPSPCLKIKCEEQSENNDCDNYYLSGLKDSAENFFEEETNSDEKTQDNSFVSNPSAQNFNNSVDVKFNMTPPVEEYMAYPFPRTRRILPKPTAAATTVNDSCKAGTNDAAHSYGNRISVLENEMDVLKRRIKEIEKHHTDNEISAKNESNANGSVAPIVEVVYEKVDGCQCRRRFFLVKGHLVYQTLVDVFHFKLAEIGTDDGRVILSADDEGYLPIFFTPGQTVILYEIS